MSYRSRQENKIFDFPGEHFGKKRKDVPCTFLREVYTKRYEEQGVSKSLASWLEINIDEIEKASDNGGDEATLNSFYKI